MIQFSDNINMYVFTTQIYKSTSLEDLCCTVSKDNPSVVIYTFMHMFYKHASSTKNQILFILLVTC